MANATGPNATGEREGIEREGERLLCYAAQRPLLHRAISLPIIALIALSPLRSGAEPPTPQVVAPPSGVLPPLGAPGPAPPTGALPTPPAGPREPAAEPPTDRPPPLVYNERRGDLILAGVLLMGLCGVAAAGFGVVAATRECRAGDDCRGGFVAATIAASALAAGGIPLVIVGTRLPVKVPKQSAGVSFRVGPAWLMVQGTF